MNSAWKTVRIFISSTFRDMQAERDHLVRFVFPRLREELLKRRVHLVDVDLRWGVTSEQDAQEVCREVIDECFPRFLCILGGRYGWVPPGKTRSITADEVHYGVLYRTENDRRYSYFYFRDEAATAAMIEAAPGESREPPGSDNFKKLAELRTAIIAAGFEPFVYPATWDHHTRQLTGLRQFGNKVYEDLWLGMASDPDLSERFEPHPATENEFDDENQAMEAFVEQHAERFVLGSREAVLEEMLAYGNSADGHYACLTGAPGIGKSALLAHLHQVLKHRLASAVIVISHFVGASSGSTDVRRTLRRLCHELKRSCPEITAVIPNDPEELRVAFQEFLRQASRGHRVVILIDAINQFDSSSHFSGLRWLPEELPSNVTLILSTLDGPALTELRERRHKPREFELKELTAADGAAIIDQFLKRYRKTFESDQSAALLAKADACTPLYLLVALEELRTLGTYEEISQRITDLPATVPELFRWIMQRLESDLGFRDADGKQVGRDLVSAFAALLGASRYGLSQRELSDLIQAGDPLGNVSALIYLLRPYLMRRAELLAFYHAQFHKVIEEIYLARDDQRRAAHSKLAKYFREQADPSGDGSWSGKSPRALNELPFHLLQGNSKSEFQETLCDLVFVEAKCKAGQVFNLLSDADMALDRWDLTPVRQLRQGVASSLRTITERPEFTLAALCNRLSWIESLDSQVGTSCGRASLLLDKRGPWLKVCSSFQAEEGVIYGSSFPYQALSYKKRAVAVVNHEGGAEIRDVTRGELIAARQLFAGRVAGIALEPQSLQIAWLETNGEVLTEASKLALRSRPNETLIAYPAEDLIIAVRQDNALVAWDPLTGDTQVLHQAVPKPLLVLRAAHDAARLVFVAGERSGLQVVGLVSREQNSWDTHILQWSAAPVVAACLDPSGCYLLLVSRNRVLHLLETEAGKIICTTAYEQRDDGIQGSIDACALGKAQTGAFLATNKGEIWRWNWQRDEMTFLGEHKTVQESSHLSLLETVENQDAPLVSTDKRAYFVETTSTARFQWHRGPVSGATVTRSGKVATISHEDCTLRWWDFNGLVPLRTFRIQPPTAIATNGDLDSVFVGTANGFLYRFPFESEPSPDDIFRLFDQQLSFLAEVKQDVVLAASRQGLIAQVDFLRDKVDWLCSHTGDRMQKTLFALPSSKRGKYISVRKLYETDQPTTIALGNGNNREEVIYRSESGFRLAVSADGSMLATKSRELETWRLEGSTLTPCFAGPLESPIVGICFLKGHEFLVLAHKDCWLELRSTDANFPVMAVIELPATPSCLSARDDRLIVGFVSGALLAVTLHSPRPH